MDLNRSRDMHPPYSSANTGKLENPFDRPSVDLSYNVQLQFLYKNAQGVKIYLDPIRQYVVKIAGTRFVHDRMPWFTYQYDMYIGIDGSRYEVIKHPYYVDSLGTLLSSGHAKPMEERPHDTNGPGTSRIPRTHSIPFDELLLDFHWDHDRKEKMGLGNTKNQWAVVKEIQVTKVFQDDLIKEVYHDA